VFGSNTPSPRDFLHQTLEHLQEKRRVYLPSDIYTSITFADDLAASLLYVASHTKEVVSGIYHVANSGMTSLYQAAAELLQYFPRRAGTLKQLHLKVTRKQRVAADACCRDTLLFVLTSFSNCRSRLS
jgi:dTDP-4-dehydrorhamnose reductase